MSWQNEGMCLTIFLVQKAAAQAACSGDNGGEGGWVEANRRS
jgi:hypothetical protein